MGGGLIKFPHENLREVEIDGDGLDGGGGGEDSDSLVDFAVSFYNENKNDENFSVLFTNLEEYNQSYKQYVTKEYGNGDNVVLIAGHDEPVAFKFTDDELAEFMSKISMFNDWRNNYISFPISHIIDIRSDGTQRIIDYDPTNIGAFGGAILGYQNSANLGLTGKENFIKLNSISEIDKMFFYNSGWIYERCQQFNLNDYDFEQVFDSTFDIYKLKCGDLDDNVEFGLIKIVNKSDNTNTMFTTYNTNGDGGDIWH